MKNTKLYAFSQNNFHFPIDRYKNSNDDLYCFICLDGGIGRRAGLKIQFFHESEGSTPSPGTSGETLGIGFGR